MPRREPHRLTRSDLLEFFLEACTPRDRWMVGMEFERMGVDASNGRRIAYHGARASVRSFLEEYLRRRGGNPVYEGENLVGLDGAWGSISLEPGGQVEWSSMPCSDLSRLADELDAHEAVMQEAAAALGIRWLDEAVDPATRLSEVPWMPKARYKILAPYLGARGRLAHRMMTQTASIQCAFDYASEEDWTRKFRAASLIAPVLVALCANSPRADGEDTGWRSFRQAIWRETDDDRSGLPPVVFDPGFGLEAWLDWLLDTPSVFLYRARGLAAAGGATFRDLMERGGCGAVTREDWLLHLSAIFTEVRSYSYIEVRSADLQPVETTLAVPALLTGILYDDDALDASVELCSGHAGYEAWRKAMDSAARLALGGEAGGRKIAGLASRIVGISIASLRRGAPCAGNPARAIGPLALLAERVGLDLRGGES